MLDDNGMKNNGDVFITYFMLCYVMLCYVSIYIAPFPFVSKFSSALFFSLSRCDTHHSMFNVMFLESNQETVLACSRYRALPTIFMTGSAGIWTQGLITSWWSFDALDHSSIHPNAMQCFIMIKAEMQVIGGSFFKMALSRRRCTGSAYVVVSWH
jgi:hypothetical protein